ncbi:MAG TPA: hypothetical protein PLH80_06365 [Spirochaetota bacterium]|nr:hypothetical protein [Spirochaetota bacterium]HQI38166.1 hypothetical protein [Spirochaetota bacterium]
MAVCSPATELAFRRGKATGKVPQPHREVRRHKMRVHIGQPAVRCMG